MGHAWGRHVLLPRLSSAVRCPPRCQRGRPLRLRGAVIRAGRMSPLVAPTPAPALLPGINRVVSLHLGKRSHGDFPGLRLFLLC